ncbi:MAG: hypothetical protein LBV36_09290 [Chromatiales bacterium]|jgi:UDP-N-acetylmuramyl pentapeptide phosphotransferase/UDP-N-acetylglucosamine-1-phosphate transferase|nr:hypothetical protein [Chromatiales bacterium]
MAGLLLIIVCTFCISCALTLLLSRAGARMGMLDHPNARSLHDTPRPRTGGLAIWAGCLAGIAVLSVFSGTLAISLWPAAALAVVGVVALIDDRSHVPALWRLLVHGLAAGLLITGGWELRALHLPGFDIALGAGTGIALTMLLVVWMTNLYNFMDGIDGLAGGMAVCGFGTLGVLGLLGGDAHYAALCAMIAAAAAGFLLWNFPPAQIFMGDSGAAVLGLLAALLSLMADKIGLFPLWVGVLVFSPFVFDATVTVLRRAARRAPVWQAHREHYYQRLVQTGWTHRRVTLCAYGLMLICALVSVLAVRATPTGQWMLIGALALLFLSTIIAIRRRESRVRPSR